MSVKAILKPIPSGDALLKHNPLQKAQTSHVTEQLDYLRRILNDKNMSDDVKMIFASEHLNKLRGGINNNNSKNVATNTIPVTTKTQDVGTDTQPENIEILQPFNYNNLNTFLEKTIDQNPFSELQNTSTPVKKPPRKRARKRTIKSPSKTSKIVKRSSRLKEKRTAAAIAGTKDIYDQAREIIDAL